MTTFSSGNGSPTPGMGADGDGYLDLSTGRSWDRANGTWFNTVIQALAPILSPVPAQRLLLGVYVGDYHDAIAGYVAWMGKPPDMASVHVGQTSADAMIAVDYDAWVNDIVWRYVNPPYTAADRALLCISQPNVYTGMTLAMAATGANDATVLASAQHLIGKVVSYAEQDITYLRGDWEHNAGWMNEWKTQNDPQARIDFVTVWRRWHDIYKGQDVQNKLRYVYCPNIAQDDPTLTYPGDAYVDVISIDFYWQPEFGDPADPVAAFAFMRDRDFGLQWQVDFAKAHGKGLAVSEWALHSDSPQYVLLCLQWFLDHGYIYANYWESNAAYQGALTPVNGASQYPNAAAAYRTAVLAIQAGATKVCDTAGNPV